MRLIGMLDSPYVRRVAISAALMGLTFEHESLSVFRDYDAFSAINPLVKAPTLVTDDGTVLMESSLILAVFDRMAAPGRHLAPAGLPDFIHHQRLVGLALAACDKSVQIVYEFNLRPEEKRHAPWVDRVTGQLRAAFRQLEQEIDAKGAWQFGDRPFLADISIAIAWRFAQEVLPGTIPVADHPALVALSTRAEALPEFRRYPYA